MFGGSQLISDALAMTAGTMGIVNSAKVLAQRTRVAERPLAYRVDCARLVAQYLHDYDAGLDIATPRNLKLMFEMIAEMFTVPAEQVTVVADARA